MLRCSEAEGVSVTFYCVGLWVLVVCLMVKLRQTICKVIFEDPVCRWRRAYTTSNESVRACM